MPAGLRDRLIAIAAALLAVVLGWQVASGQYLLALFVAGLLGLIALEWFGEVRPEGIFLGVLVIGYVLGNRGFAQISLAGNIPLFFGEVGLAAGGGLLIARSALARRLPFEADWINRFLLIWMVLGTMRIGYDVRIYGAAAVRDFATLYYAGYFFIAQAVMAHAGSARWLGRCALIATACLPIVSALYAFFPHFFLNTFLIRGVPVIFLKEDLQAAYSFAGFFLLLAQAGPRPLGWRWIAATACYGTAFTVNSSRAALVGLVVACGAWAGARRWAPFKLQAIVVPLGLAVLAAIAVVRDEDFRQSRLYSLYEHVASIVDITGRGRYQTEARRYVGDNNRFRLAWWRSVAAETWRTNPIFGLGFGHDLADRFVRNYEYDLGDDFSTRSPHSIVLTVFGRMGLVGLMAFLALIGAIAARTQQTVRSVMREADALPELGWWSAAWVILVSACFGVVIEGPMGAIVFWIFLGMANQALRAREMAAAESRAPQPTERNTPAGLHLAEPRP